MDLTGKHIKDYEQVFQCSYAERAETITWTKWPVSRASLAFRRLMGTSAGHTAFAVFVGLVRLCARSKTGGSLTVKGKALTVADIHGETGIPARMIPPALFLLNSEPVGWIVPCASGALPAHVESAPKAQTAHNKSTGGAPPFVSVSVSDSDSSVLKGVQGDSPESKEPSPFYLADALRMVNEPVLDGIGDLWADWMRIRFSAPRHKRPTRRAAQLALGKLEPWPPPKRRAALENAIGGCWQGLVEPKENGNANGRGNHRENKRANEYPETLTVPVARVPVNGGKGWDSQTPL